MVDGVHLVIHIREKQILPPVLIIVGRIDTHAGAGTTILTVSDPGREADFFELAFPIDKTKIGNGVIGHEKIHQVLVLTTGLHAAPALPGSFADAASPDASPEHPAAVCMNKEVRTWL